MKNLIPILILTAFIVAFIGSLLCSPKLFRRVKLTAFSSASLFCGGLRENLATANTETAAGTHKVRNMRADAAHSYTHLLVKQGTDAFHVAVAGAADFPIGSTSDSPDAADDIVHVDPLNRTDASRRLRCATALAANIDLYTAASGFVQGEPAVAGTYYKIGRSAALAVQEGSSNYVIEAVTRPPVKVVVVAALTATTNIGTLNSTAVNPTKTDFDALLVAAEKVRVDLLALGTALATPAEVKVLA